MKNITIGLNFLGYLFFFLFIFSIKSSFACIPEMNQLISPSSGTVIANHTVTFTWGGGSCVGETKLTIGTSMDSSNVYTGTSSSNSITVNNIPLTAPNNQIYIDLSSYGNGTWSPPAFYAFNVFNPPPTGVNLSVNNTSFTIPANIVITANPSANGYGYISRVEFYADGKLLSTSNNSPYTYTWSNATQGNHSIITKAYNGLSGVVATSSAINVTVYTPPGFIAFDDNQCPAKL